MQIFLAPNPRWPESLIPVSFSGWVWPCTYLFTINAREKSTEKCSMNHQFQMDYSLFPQITTFPSPHDNQGQLCHPPWDSFPFSLLHWLEKPRVTGEIDRFIYNRTVSKLSQCNLINLPHLNLQFLSLRKDLVNLTQYQNFD